MSEPIVSAVDLVKTYRVKGVARNVVNGVSLQVNAGEVVGLLGKNGAGKTTTFNMIVGLARPTGGEIFLNGENIAQMPMYRRARRGIGYLPQEESIFRKLTVEDNLMAILETLHLSDGERRQKLEALLEEFGMRHVRKSKAYMLSGGEKRRLSIARCLSTDPSIVLLDEPFSGVDPLAVNNIQDIIISIRNKGVSVLITDHNVRETLSVVDRAYLICDGKVESEGTSEFLINDPVAREIYLGHRFSL
ncbi:MAG: LPS export ABC transporter ATP-binding protein [Verrucomicrobiales bacterium]|jgi:lipopolysaccharide export system ATP-binding protein|nr:LPS export ABC transporter ATP-binding protein [Verrucomicrobiales bacterium]